MDFAPNLSWFLPGVGLAYIWLRQAPRDTSQRRVQMLARGVLPVISLTAVSMTNDLVAQNPAEDGCSLR
jgi:hypothetical protein